MRETGKIKKCVCVCVSQKERVRERMERAMREGLLI